MKIELISKMTFILRPGFPHCHGGDPSPAELCKYLKDSEGGRWFYDGSWYYGFGYYTGSNPQYAKDSWPW